MPNLESPFVELLERESKIDNAGNLEVIVKYNGDIQSIGEQLGASVEILGEDYAIITLAPEKVESLYNFTQIQYIERPKSLTLFLAESLGKACITSVQSSNGYNLSGNGVVVGIIDSGIDYTHPDFRNADGTTRILYIWDQAGIGTPPKGFKAGAEYSSEMINAALASPQPFEIIPPTDIVGHGTAVSGIAAGNGRASRGRDRGVAPEASLIVIKLGQRGSESFARTTEVMRGIKYIIDKAQELLMPVSINISFGTNNGSHDGSSLFETYIDSVSQRWKSVISVASGNEGAAGHHYTAQMKVGERLVVDFTTSGNLSSVIINVWTTSADSFSYELIAPSGQSSGVIAPSDRLVNKTLNGLSLLVYNGQPTNYNEDQQILFQLSKGNAPIPEGLWKIVVNALEVSNGEINMWLPTIEEVSTRTAFLIPSVTTTLTLPSTANNVVSVGAYSSQIDSVTEFSGRGYTRGNVYVKPDLVAPGVGIVTTSIGGGYDSFTGTSMAAPFVTGSAALMMQWGIVNGNDPFLYGQRVKAFLKKGATRDKNIPYPNAFWGYGKLCLKSSMDYLVEYDAEGSVRI